MEYVTRRPRAGLGPCPVVGGRAPRCGPVGTESRLPEPLASGALFRLAHDKLSRRLTAPWTERWKPSWIATLIESLERSSAPSGVFSRPADLLVYEYDGSVDGAVETAARRRGPADDRPAGRRDRSPGSPGWLPVVARGAGTGLSGGAVPQQAGSSSA